MSAPCLFLQRLGVDALDRPFKSSTMRGIAQRIATSHGITLDELRGHSRRRLFVLPRQEAMAKIRDVGRFSYPQIAQFFDGRDHTTVLHGVRAHAARLAEQEGAA